MKLFISVIAILLLLTVGVKLLAVAYLPFPRESTKLDYLGDSIINIGLIFWALILLWSK